MTPQTIVLKVAVKDEEHKIKTMTIAGATSGVDETKFEKGNELKVVGKGVNAGLLWQTLNKNVGDTKLLTISIDSSDPGTEEPGTDE